jgi:hypothetical protein
MGLPLCTAEYMISDTNGLGMRSTWFPRIVDEAMLKAEKDGDIQYAPDPVTTISGSLYWFNNSPDDQIVSVLVKRAARSIITTNPCTVTLQDGWTFQVSENPTADDPAISTDGFGGKLLKDTASTAADKLEYGRLILDTDVSQAWVSLGVVPAREAFHFRYLCAVFTPGLWIEAEKPAPKYSATARYTKLTAFASPAESVTA